MKASALKIGDQIEINHRAQEVIAIEATEAGVELELKTVDTPWWSFKTTFKKNTTVKLVK